MATDGWPRGRRVWPVVAAILLAGTLVLGLRREVRIDLCLDRGGAWNYEMGDCDAE